MNRDDLVERVARAIHDTDDMCNTVWPDGDHDDGHRGGGGYVRLCQCPEVYRQAARAALAIIEPAVREECARVAEAAEAGCFDGNLGNFCWRIAASIRAGAKP